MSYPVERDPAPAHDLGDPAPDEGTDPVETSETGTDESEWSEGASAFPLAYAYPEDDPPEYANEREAAEIEATLLSDLEAAANAFWLDLGGEGNAASTAPADAPERRDAVEDDFESLAWTDPDFTDLIGPEPRPALIDFRPPRAAKRNGRATRIETDSGVVNFDVQSSPDGAFADDLAARNKEFYELLRTGSGTRRKIGIPEARRSPRSEPGFETIFPRPEPAASKRAVARRNGLRMQSLAVSLLAVLIGGGVVAIAMQWAAPEGEAATVALAEARADSVAPTGAKETDAVPAPDAGAPGIGPTDATAALPRVDPGTLATPPLYEPEEAAPAGPDTLGVGVAPPDFAALPLRSTAPAGAPEPDPFSLPAAALPETTEPPPDAAAEVTPGTGSADEPLAGTARETEATDTEGGKAEPEPVRTAAAKPEKPEKTDRAAGTTRALRIPAGRATINTAVNMRAGPDNGAKVVRVLKAGTEVEIVGCRLWCEVIAGGDRGWVFQRFISRDRRAEAPSEPARAREAAPAQASRGPLDLLGFGKSE